ncbi:hypothetical protein BDL97_04G023200 [Sphagnum fallax]|nr:hypothetical protein BDL97_04G023200 [Sphagnum fallax]
MNGTGKGASRKNGSGGRGKKGGPAKTAAVHQASPRVNGGVAAYPVGGWDNGSDVQVSASSPILAEGAQIRQGPLLSPSDSGWHADAGAPVNNGWDDIDTWVPEPSYGNGMTGQESVKDFVADTGWETVGKTRGKTLGKLDPPQAGRGKPKHNNTGLQDKDKGAKFRARGSPSVEPNGSKGNGRGSPLMPQSQAWGNTRTQEHPFARNSDWDSIDVHSPAQPNESWQQTNQEASFSSISGKKKPNRAGKRGSSSSSQRSFPPGQSYTSLKKSASYTGNSVGGNPSQQAEHETNPDDYPASVYSESQCSDLGDMEDDSDDAFISDADYDSDMTQKSHETQKKLKWFRDFFQDLDCLTDAQLHEHDRQWHCPPCKGGVGGTEWFRGLGPLATHARTMRSRRVKLHRNFAEVLDEELRLRRVGANTSGPESMFGKWKGLREDDEAQFSLIVWPPMVVVENTRLEKDEQEKWTGMGNKELMEYFKEYNPVKPRHAYGPQGHRGMSLLIFGNSPAGYHDAEHLDKHFKDSRRGRDDWNRPSKLLFHPGGNRILYGYLAVREDLETFNRHSRGKTVVKYEMKSLREAVLEPMQRIGEQTQHMQQLQNKVEKEQEVSKVLKETVSMVSKNLSLREQELQILRRRAEEQHARNKQEQAEMEEFFQAERDQLAEEFNMKEAELEKLRDEFDQMHAKRCSELEAQQSDMLVNNQKHQQALMEAEISIQTKRVHGSLCHVQDLETQLVELQQRHHELRIEFQKKQHEASVEFEQQLKAERAELLRAYESQMHHKEEAA